MKKYSTTSNKENQELLQEFCEAISVLNSAQEIMNFLVDLLTKQEIIMLAKRIKIAKLLLSGQDYRDIEKLLRVSHGTIAKVNQWLTDSGEGFRLVTKRTKKEMPKPKGNWDYAMDEWKTLKRRYPIMFWPQLLIEDIVKTMNKRQKEKVRHAINKLDQKSRLYKEINKILKS